MDPPVLQKRQSPYFALRPDFLRRHFIRYLCGITWDGSAQPWRRQRHHSNPAKPWLRYCEPDRLGDCRCSLLWSHLPRLWRLLRSAKRQKDVGPIWPHLRCGRSPPTMLNAGSVVSMKRETHGATQRAKIQLKDIGQPNEVGLNQASSYCRSPQRRPLR